MVYTLLPIKKKRINLRDYGKHLLWFEDINNAEHAEEVLERKKIVVSRMHNELGFASSKSRDKAKQILNKVGIPAVKV